jgi:hypothetical protein
MITKEKSPMRPHFSFVIMKPRAGGVTDRALLAVITTTHDGANIVGH